MLKELPMLLLASFVLAGTPGRAEEAASTAPASPAVDGFPGACQSGGMCRFQTGKVTCFCL